MGQQDDERLHGLDAVRGLALVAGVVLHAAMAFLPGPQLWLVADRARSTTLSVLFFVIHIARMTLFFVLAGFFARLLFQRTGWVAFVRNRLTRIAIPMLVAWPLVFGSILAVLNLSTPGGAAAATGFTVETFPLTHLWFLYVLLLLYAGALLLRAAVVTIDPSGRLRHLIDTAMRAIIRPGAPLLLALPVTWALYLHPYWARWFGVPTPDAGFVPNRAALITYGLAFGLGWLIQRQAVVLLPRIKRSWGLHLVLAVAATVFCLGSTSLEPLLAPVPFGAAKMQFAFAYAVGLWSWAFGLIGMGLRFMAGYSPLRRYLADASYWIYLAHLPVVLALQLLMRNWPLPWPVKFALLLGVAMALLLLSYHWLVRPTAIGALLNGRRYPRGATQPSSSGTTTVKVLSLLLLLPSILVGQSVVAPAALPLDTVIARHIAAVGPIDRMQTRRVSMRVTGMAPFEIPVTVEAMRPNLLLKKVTIQGAVQITGYDGRSAWRVDPFVSSSKKAVDVPAAELEDLMEETDFDGPLMHAAAKRNRLRYVGPAVVTVLGKPTPVHAIELTQANGRQAIVHLDATSYLEVLRTQTRMVMGTATPMKITSTDYRTVLGVRVPYLTEIAIAGMAEPIRLKIDAVLYGVSLTPKEFARP
ncbi:MAG: acyltransferase [Gemmatimonadales bacterium]